MERTNVLIKLRETLLDSDKKSNVTVPEGLAYYPNNLFWAAMTWLGVGLFSYGFIVGAYELERIDKAMREKAAKGNSNK